MIRPHALALALLTCGALAACSGSDAAIAPADFPTWSNTQVNLVSRTTTGAGVAALTSMRADGALETVAVELTSGKKLWAQPATMAGRLPGMGVQAPATVETAPGQGVVVALDPAKQGRWNATLMARDARTGKQLWTRPVHSTFGPQRCGRFVCMSEHTALANARMVVLDPLTGRLLWKMPGIAEVEWADDQHVIILRLAANPVVEAYSLKDGKPLWQQPVQAALGNGVDLSGGWAFGVAGDRLVGYIAPYTHPKTGKTSTFGMFSIRMNDGVIDWVRPSVVRVYPSGNPAVSPVVRPVDDEGTYGGFARLDGQSGRVMGQITATQVPGSGWWLAFPSAMNTLGFLKHNAPGSAFDLSSGQATQAKGVRSWSFCVTDPQPLGKAAAGFYSVASLCEFDLATGKRTTDQGAPPAWFTGAQNGWRLWRDEKGALHGIKDATTTLPGMYG